MILPNFLIIGAAKSGTSSIYDYLKQHPQIYMSSIKEPIFFAFEGEQIDEFGPFNDDPLAKGTLTNSATNIDDYQALFRDVDGEKAIGEASVRYLYFSKSPNRIKKYIPEAKLIAILRNPVDRAYSHFLMNLRKQFEPLNDFSKALQAEEKRKLDNWGWDWHYLSDACCGTGRSFFGVMRQQFLNMCPRSVCR